MLYFENSTSGVVISWSGQVSVLPGISGSDRVWSQKWTHEHPLSGPHQCPSEPSCPANKCLDTFYCLLLLF